jgi:transposase
MAKALSVDLRRRVVESIEQGMSCRAAAGRYGVSAASAVRWHQQFKATGTVSPRKQGGDRRSKRIEAYAALIVEAITKQPDITLAELQARFSAERGVHFAIGTLWRFFKRHRITFKKRRRMLPNSSVRM